MAELTPEQAAILIGVACGVIAAIPTTLFLTLVLARPGRKRR